MEWMDGTDIDGFNLAYVVAHDTYKDVVDLLVPELQRRGVYPTKYPEGTLREKLGASEPHLTAPHPAENYSYKTAISADDVLRRGA